MEQRRVGDSEISVSAIGLGCVTFGREIDQETSFQIMLLSKGLTSSIRPKVMLLERCPPKLSLGTG